MLKIRFVTNEAALVAGRNLVVPDLHLGMEFEIWKKGINMPSQTQKILDRIIRLINTTKANHVIILGDIKHEIYSSSKQETREVPLFFEELLKRVKVSVVKGNHDAGIEGILPEEVALYPSEGFRIDNVAFAHGNAWIPKDSIEAETLVMGHLHPSIEFKDYFDRRVSEHCWVRAKIKPKAIQDKYKTKDFNLKEIIIMPTFNRLTGGSPVNSEEGKKDMGPFMKNVIDKKTMEMFLLDGTSLGTIS